MSFPHVSQATRSDRDSWLGLFGFLFAVTVILGITFAPPQGEGHGSKVEQSHIRNATSPS